MRDKMCNNLSFSISILLLVAIFNPCLSHEVASHHVDDHPLIGTNRETLEIIIGGGGGGIAPAPSPPDNEDCPPPPPPPCTPPLPPPKPPSPPKPPNLNPHPHPHRHPHPHPRPRPRPRPPSPRGCGYRYNNMCFENERIAKAYRVIQDFKKLIFIDSNSKKFTETWNGPNVCKYYGFKCEIRPDVKKNAVAAVDFNGGKFVGLNGSLPLNNFIDRLEDLAIYHANSNSFTGKLPVIGISKINYLYELDLSNNKLESDFPMEVLAAKNLTFLDIRFNNFKGPVPSSVFNLDLDVLFINNNKFQQPLPDNVGDSPVLYLTFANNFFTGPIPKSIGRAPKLLEVLFLNNQFSGCLPYEIGNLSQATVFDVGTNKLTGPIPYSFGCLKKIELLNLANNEFYGEVPEIVCQLTKLENLSLSNNYFTQVGPVCRDLIMKKKLDVRNNCILDLPQQRSKGDCSEFFSRKWNCERKESYKLVPCMKGKHGDLDWKSTEESDEESTASSSPSARTYNALKPHRL
ncbi:hypothetical protein HRI_004647700 [Hibiscus trionum]|uniref:Leucine-rich repeat-containing N-terminal plant-type domain-containing protein n=1 Tax=Hibiscus trionum TaxID=183268 RepID=A0A9W7J852_HIBTR|nr:hypothetical protein HRI_004647700 [Hibiscus trionum]